MQRASMHGLLHLPSIGGHRLQVVHCAPVVGVLYISEELLLPCAPAPRSGSSSLAPVSGRNFYISKLATMHTEVSLLVGKKVTRNGESSPPSSLTSVPSVVSHKPGGSERRKSDTAMSSRLSTVSRRIHRCEVFE